MADFIGIDINALKKSTEEAKKQVLLQINEFIRSLVIDTWRFITANSLEVGIAFGSPVLSGQYYTNHRIMLNGVDSSVNFLPNRDDDSPVSGLPLTTAALIMRAFKLGDSVTISNSLPYAKRIEDGWSRFKAPEGVYSVAADRIQVKYGKGLG